MEKGKDILSVIMRKRNILETDEQTDKKSKDTML